MKKSKISLSLIALSMLAGIGLTGCFDDSSNSTTPKVSDTTKEDSQIRTVYEAYKANGGTLSYEEWLQSIKGDKGDKGDTGATGAKGDKGDKGDDGKSIVSITKTFSSGNVDTYTITYSDGTTSTYTVTNGTDGAKGDTGAAGAKGDTGATGDKGDAGKDGSTWLTGVGSPKDKTDLNAKDGDFYFDTESGKVYRLVSSIWEEIYTLPTQENEQSHTVTFDLHGGSYSGTTTFTVIDGNPLTVFPEPVKDGYELVGFFLDEEGLTSKYTNTTPIYEDITLHAVYAEYGLDSFVDSLISDFYNYLYSTCKTLDVLTAEERQTINSYVKKIKNSRTFDEATNNYFELNDYGQNKFGTVEFKIRVYKYKYNKQIELYEKEASYSSYATYLVKIIETLDSLSGYLVDTSIVEEISNNAISEELNFVCNLIKSGTNLTDSGLTYLETFYNLLESYNSFLNSIGYQVISSDEWNEYLKYFRDTSSEKTVKEVLDKYLDAKNYIYNNIEEYTYTSNWKEELLKNWENVLNNYNLKNDIICQNIYDQISIANDEDEMFANIIQNELSLYSNFISSTDSDGKNYTYQSNLIEDAINNIKYVVSMFNDVNNYNNTFVYNSNEFFNYLAELSEISTETTFESAFNTLSETISYMLNNRRRIKETKKDISLYLNYQLFNSLEVPSNFAKVKDLYNQLLDVFNNSYQIGLADTQIIELLRQYSFDDSFNETTLLSEDLVNQAKNMLDSQLNYLTANSYTLNDESSYGSLYSSVATFNAEDDKTVIEYLNVVIQCYQQLLCNSTKGAVDSLDDQKQKCIDNFNDRISSFGFDVKSTTAYSNYVSVINALTSSEEIDKEYDQYSANYVTFLNDICASNSEDMANYFISDYETNASNYSSDYETLINESLTKFKNKDYSEISTYVDTYLNAIYSASYSPILNNLTTMFETFGISKTSSIVELMDLFKQYTSNYKYYDKFIELGGSKCFDYISKGFSELLTTLKNTPTDGYAYFEKMATVVSSSSLEDSIKTNYTELLNKMQSGKDESDTSTFDSLMEIVKNSMFNTSI